MPDLEIVVSAPESGRSYSASLVPLRRCRPIQTLFGYDAQMAAFRAVAEAHGVKTWLAPFPQLFSLSAPVSANRCAAAAHVRFGPAVQARVLKGLRNLALTAEDPLVAPLNLGRHPLADGLRLPATMERVYGLAPRRLPLQRVGGEAPPWRPLPDAFVTHDLVAAISGAPEPDDEDDVLETLGGQGLDIRSGADFDLDDWTTEAGLSFAPSPHLRAVDPDGAARLVMIPWNLSHPGSAAPGMLATLSQSAGVEGAAIPVVFPYNQTSDSAAMLAGFLEQLDTESRRRNLLRHIFFGRLAQITAARGLSRVVSAAWLDASDPEHVWVHRRLNAINVPTVLFGGPADAGGLAPDFRRMTLVKDSLGQRLVEAPVFSLRAFALAGRRAHPPGQDPSLPPANDLEAAGGVLREMAQAA